MHIEYTKDASIARWLQQLQQTNKMLPQNRSDHKAISAWQGPENRETNHGEGHWVRCQGESQMTFSLSICSALYSALYIKRRLCHISNIPLSLSGGWIFPQTVVYTPFFDMLWFTRKSITNLNIQNIYITDNKNPIRLFSKWRILLKK